MIAGADIQQAEGLITKRPFQKNELGYKGREEGFKIHAQIYEDARYGIRDSGYWIPGTGYWKSSNI